jgi:phage tail protein X
MTLSGQTYRCSGGETFDKVALIIYGDEKYACELLGANPSLCTIPVFTGGEVLELPVVEVTENSDEEDYMPASAPWKE